MVAKTKKEPEKIERWPRGATQNGAKILAFMRSNKVRGNFRDFVMFVGDTMLDNYGSYTFARKAEPGAQTVALIHKSKLAEVIGEELAARFWDSKHRRRTNYGAPRGKV